MKELNQHWIDVFTKLTPGELDPESFAIALHTRFQNFQEDKNNRNPFCNFAAILGEELLADQAMREEILNEMNDDVANDLSRKPFEQTPHQPTKCRVDATCYILNQFPQKEARFQAIKILLKGKHTERLLKSFDLVFLALEEAVEPEGKLELLKKFAEQGFSLVEKYANQNYNRTFGPLHELLRDIQHKNHDGNEAVNGMHHKTR